MIYKQFYRLCTLLLAVGMGLMYWESSTNHNKQQVINQQLIQTLQSQNKLLVKSFPQFKSKLKDDTKKKPTYKRLYALTERIEKITKPCIKLIEREISQLNYKESIDANYVKVDYENTVLRLLVSLDSMLSARNLGIKNSEIESLKERMDFTVEHSNFIFKAKDQVSKRLYLLKMKNRMLYARYILGRYLSCKIGGWTPYNAMSIYSSAESLVYRVGEQFKADIILVEKNGPISLLKEVYINGKSFPILDNGLIKFEEHITRKGKIPYEVKMVIENTITGKKSTETRSFFYVVI